MTIEEAIRRLEIYKEFMNEFDVLTKEVIDAAVEALKKQIAQPPSQPKDKVRHGGMGYEYYDYYCPNCESLLELEPEGNRKFGFDFCYRCGQKLIWNDQKNKIKEDINFRRHPYEKKE